MFPQIIHPNYSYPQKNIMLPCLKKLMIPSNEHEDSSFIDFEHCKLDIHLESDESHLSPKSVPQIIYLLLFIYSFSYIYLLFIHRLYVCIYIDYIV